jgi:hypothetical protein
MNIPRDIRHKILEELPDREIVKNITLNKALYNDDSFFRHLIQKRYPLYSEELNTVSSARNLYLEILRDTAILKDEFHYYYNEENNNRWFDGIQDVREILRIAKENLSSRVIKLFDQAMEEQNPKDNVLDTVLDISFMDERGGDIELINRPSKNSKKKQIDNLPVYSSDGITVVYFAKLIGDYSLPEKWKGRW